MNVSTFGRSAKFCDGVTSYFAWELWVNNQVKFHSVNAEWRLRVSRTSSGHKLWSCFPMQLVWDLLRFSLIWNKSRAEKNIISTVGVKQLPKDFLVLILKISVDIVFNSDNNLDVEKYSYFKKISFLSIFFIYQRYLSHFWYFLLYTY